MESWKWSPAAPEASGLSGGCVEPGVVFPTLSALSHGQRRSTISVVVLTLFCLYWLQPFTLNVSCFCHAVERCSPDDNVWTLAPCSYLQVSFVRDRWTTRRSHSWYKRDLKTALLHLCTPGQSCDASSDHDCRTVVSQSWISTRLSSCCRAP